MIVVARACRREIESLPEEIRGDLADALARLDAAVSPSMPTIGPGVHELRLKNRSGAYRVIYALLGSGRVHALHALKKTAQETPLGSLDLVRKRLKEAR